METRENSERAFHAYGKPMEAVSSGGVTRGVSEKDGDAGALHAPAHTRHRGDAVGGQPPPSTVSPVRPTGHQEDAQWAPPGDLAV